MWRQIFLGTLFCLTLSIHADTQAKGAKRWKVEVGGGGATFQAPWKGVNVESTPLPFVAASYGRWGFGVGEGLVQYSLLESDVNVGFSLGYRDETYQSDYAIQQYESDDLVFTGYNSPKGEVTARLHLEYRYFHLRLVQDIQGRSDAATATVRTDIPLYRHASGWQIAGRAGVSWMQDKYASYVFGVSLENADERFGRTEYTADNAVNYFVGLQLYIPMPVRHSLRGFARYEFLDEEITGSPLIGQNYRAQVGLMYVVTLLNGL